MPNDAKLGMVFGVALVIVVAVVFFRKDTTASDAFATIPKPTPAVTQPPPRAPAATGPSAEASLSSGQKHVVVAGDTLQELSRRYYGTRDKFDLIYQANKDQLVGPDRLQPGKVLTIPDAH
jgi:nucleoid-associated protein YgaU